MRPKKPKTTEEGDLFRARLDQIINMKHELVGREGDAANVILTAVGHNLRRILAWLRATRHWRSPLGSLPGKGIDTPIGRRNKLLRQL